MALRISFNCTPYWLLTQLANPSASSQDFKARLIFNFHRASPIIFVYVLDLLTKNVHGAKQHKYDNKRMHRVRGSPSNLVLRHGWVTFGAEAGNNRQCSERVGRSLATAAAENTCGCCWCCFEWEIQSRLCNNWRKSFVPRVHRVTCDATQVASHWVRRSRASNYF